MKSFPDVDETAWAPRTPSDRLLMLLKIYGAQTSGEIGQRQGVTGEAVRQQLLKLQEEDAVAQERRISGRGRPKTYWYLTERGQARFPDTHASLTVEILRNITEVLGTEALDRVIAECGAATLVRYGEAMAGCTDIRERLHVLARLRSDEGYMASVEEEEDGTFRLIESHCPIGAAASSCLGFCRMEKAVFQKVLGSETIIEREEHIMESGRRCTYLVRESEKQ